MARFEPYVLGDNFESYLRRLEGLFAITNVTEDVQKVRRLKYYLGATAEEKLENLFLPANYIEKTFDEVIAKCKELFVSLKRPIVEKHRLHLRNQRDEETLTDYAIELQAIAQHCNYGNYLDTALRDRFISGVQQTTTREKLLNLEEENFKDFAKLFYNDMSEPLKDFVVDVKVKPDAKSFLTCFIERISHCFCDIPAEVFQVSSIVLIEGFTR